jgi:hypothetical protein
LSHARLKAEQRSVGGSSLPKEIRKAGDYVNGVRDQIEMLQYVRGRIGEDRDTVLDICAHMPGHGAGVATPMQGQTSDPPRFATLLAHKRGQRAREAGAEAVVRILARHARRKR